LIVLFSPLNATNIVIVAHRVALSSGKKARDDSISSNSCVESGGNDLDDKKKVPTSYDVVKAAAGQSSDQAQLPMRKR
jgi:hypothetical protein